MTECVNKSELACRMRRSMSVMVLAISVLSAAETASLDSQQLNRILDLKTAMQVSRFPAGFWNYADLERHGEHFDQEEVKSWANAGFTVTQSPGFNAQNSRHIAHIRSLLEWASVYNLKLIVNDPRVYNPAPDAEEIIKGGIEAYRQSITAAVDDFSGLNALFGFHIGDEPQGDWNRSYVEAYKMLKDITPNLHPFMNLLPYQNPLHLVGFKSWPQYLDTIASEAKAELLCYD